MKPAIASLALLAACARPTPLPPAAQTLPSPRLVVLIVVDQLPLRLYEAARPDFSGGLARLSGPEGFTAVARYPVLDTFTSVGHSILSTGAAPNATGVVANHWPEGGQMVTCCDDLSPVKVETLGDRVAAAGGEVVSLSLKSRGAVLMSARRSTLRAAYSTREGVFEGGEGLVSAEQVAARRAEPWTPLRPDRLEAWAPDAGEAEGDWYGLGTTFPHPATTALSGRAFLATPAAGALLTDAAIAALERTRLGQDDTPDLLAISYSNIDYIGHTFTPDSQEALDAVLRLDQDLGRLFAALDARLGPGASAVLLSSDHGAAGPPTLRLPEDEVVAKVSAALKAAGLPSEGVELADYWLWLPGAKKEASRAVALDVLRALPGVADAWVCAEGVPFEAPFAEQKALSCYPWRSGDVGLIMVEGAIADDAEQPGKGTRHGSPYAYDTDVPLLLWGAGVAPGAATGLLDPRQVAPTLAKIMGIEAPAGAQAGPVEAALREP